MIVRPGSGNGHDRMPRDVLTVSRRLGHGSPVVILMTYGHLFEKTDTAAASAIEAAMRTGIER
jgi:hypothetical protein